MTVTLEEEISPLFSISSNFVENQEMGINFFQQILLVSIDRHPTHYVFLRGRDKEAQTIPGRNMTPFKKKK